MKETELTEYLYYEDIPKDILDNLLELESNPKIWMKLYKNLETGQLWVIDVWDKYIWQMAFKIKEKENWENINFEKYRKKLLLKNRGGLQNEICIWKGCSKKRVKGVKYCIDHLYETGTRK